MNADHAIPLIVDVDGTLLRTDLLHEAALQYAARHPLELWRLAGWLARGKSVLKDRLAAEIPLDMHTMPLRNEVVARIRAAQAVGRPVYLASASAICYIEPLAARIGGVTDVYASTPGINLTGHAKRDLLVAEHGARGYDYIGDHPVDFAVWDQARGVLAVSHNPDFARRVQERFSHAEILVSSHPQLRDYLSALRPHQWAKNLLVFLPMLAGHQFDAHSIIAAFIALFCFSLCASSTYILNDLLDLPADREHARKRVRPFAAGTVPVAHGLGLGAVLLAVGAAVAAAVSLVFLEVLAFYFATTLAYSLVLKRRLLIDVITLGVLYTVRVLGGLVAVHAILSPWLLMFCLFIFLALAIVKRCSELESLRAVDKPDVSGRGYLVTDLQAMAALGAAAGYGAVLVISLYINSAEVVALYHYPVRLWLVCPALLYWISRILVLSLRGQMHDDPVIFAIKDRVSWMTALWIALVSLAAA